MKYKIQKLLFLIAGLLVSLNASAYSFLVDGIAYNVNPDGMSVSVTFDKLDEFRRPIPTYIGYIDIPERVTHGGTTYSVTEIGNGAFIGCTELRFITIPNSVTSIEVDAFKDCKGLTKITIPNSVTWIGNFAFRGCTGLKSITIPNSVTWLGDCVFQVCTGLTSVTIGNSVSYIGDGTFSGCTGLNSLVVESGNPDFDSRDNCNAIIETATNTLLQGCNTTVIPNSVTSIGYAAFQSCKSLASITIPSSVTKIGISAFRGCSGLKSVTISNSVSKIEDFTFFGCTELTNVTIPNSVTSIGSEAFFKCSALRNVKIPNSVITIGPRAFQGSGLANITIPNTVTSVGESAFGDCPDFTYINFMSSTPPQFGPCIYVNRPYAYVPVGCEKDFIKAGWTLIKGGLRFGELLYDFKTADSVFAVYRPDDMAIKNCKIPSEVYGCKVTSIMENAFNGCAGLASLTIPSTIDSIGADAFLNCNVRTITIDDLNWWFRADNTLSLQGPGAIFLNGTLIEHLVIPDGISTVRASAFANCLSITGITIPNSVTEINDQAFMGCSHLQNVIIGESVLNIGMQVFKGCPNIKEITCLGSLPATIYADTFQNYDATLFVPGGSLNHYKSAEHWLNFNRMTEGVSGVEGIESDGIKVAVNGGAIEVSGADGKRVEVYSLSGQCIYSGMETSIPVEKGIYIVRVAGETHKVIL